MLSSYQEGATRWLLPMMARNVRSVHMRLRQGPHLYHHAIARCPSLKHSHTLVIIQYP